ncbi:MAG: c-type cytochrome [Chloroflexi bacterium]|nr:c-type cytochrome [Chloroflexota bacterium]
MRTHRMLTPFVLVALGGLAIVMLVFASTSLAAPAADAARGKQVWDKACAVCHGFEGKGGPIAPPLGKDTVYFKEVGLPVQAVAAIVNQATKQRPPGAMMPVLNPGQVTDADAADITDYLWTLSSAPAAVIPPGNAQNGAAPYAANCAACHGARGEGATAMPVAGMAAGLKAGGAPAPVMHALVRLASRSGSVPRMPTFAPDKLSDGALADIAAFIWELPPPAPPPGAPAKPAPAKPAPAAPVAKTLPRTGGLLPPFGVIAAAAATLAALGVGLRRRA